MKKRPSIQSFFRATRRCARGLTVAVAAGSLLLGSSVNGCADGSLPTGSSSGSEQPATNWLDVIGAKPVEDLGALEGGTSFEHVVRFVNRADQPVRLSPHVLTSCGCAKAKLSKLRLKPGEEGRLALTVDAPARNSRRQGAFAFVRAVEPPDLPPVQIGVVYDTFVAWTVLPSELRFMGRPREPQVGTFRVLGGGLRDLTIMDISCDIPGCTARLERRNLRKRAQTVGSLRFVLPAETGSFRYRLVIQTDDPQVPRAEIPVLCNVLSAYRVIPPRVLVVSGRQEGRAIAR